ncbi:MAG: double-stranded DNA-binding protein [Thaumarchaeota archaeon]|jgi:DNA-binding TFAR19-related protein (PDSD5 family)|nr:MAG: double-stranded DNA-binding protein [Nitrososphaerota archaeon]TLX89214.1 MAG: double-stranded DNA-binding protein [Nitrososphaerota archaeon]
MNQEEDPELAIIKARKMKQLKEKAAMTEKIKEGETKSNMAKIDDRGILLKYLYDRGDEVLQLAELQYPVQARVIVKRIVDLIKSGEIDSLISGGELLAIFRSVGLRIRVDTNIRIEDHGKFISFGEKLKEGI